MPFLSFLAQVVLLVIAVSVDAFVASFAYGTNQIRIPFLSALLVSFICSAFLAVSMLVGDWIGTMIPQEVVYWISFFLLFLIGLVKLFDSMIKRWIAKHQNTKRQISFHVSNLRMILQIYADVTEADQDASRVLSFSEAAGLAVALSFDSIAAGVGAGLTMGEFGWTLLISFLIGIAAILLGEWFGRKIRQTIHKDFSFIGGILLILLAFCKL
jgi:putative sporulation protein YtaF